MSEIPRDLQRPRVQPLHDHDERHIRGDRLRQLLAMEQALLRIKALCDHPWDAALNDHGCRRGDETWSGMYGLDVVRVEDIGAEIAAMGLSGSIPIHRGRP